MLVYVTNILNIIVVIVSLLLGAAFADDENHNQKETRGTSSDANDGK